MQQLNPDMLKSFKSYDIRGTYPDQIDETFYYHLGNAFARYIGNTGVAVVGHDARLSSESLNASFIQGVTDGGVDVTDLGNISTEMLYFGARTLKPDAAVMITASHNPKEYNGAKLAIKDLVPLHGTYGLPEIKAFMQQDAVIAPHKGTVTNHNLMQEWIDFLLTFVQASSWKPLKLVVDSGNGMSGPTWHKLVTYFPQVTFYPLFTDPDGNFPNHPSETSNPENLKYLVAKVQEVGADIGLAFDGDVDRIAVVDENGQVVNGDVLGAFLADYFLKKPEYKGRPVTYNATCGKIVPETIEKNGSKAIRTKAGHTLIKTAMRAEQAFLGVELSGHYYFEFNDFTENMSVIGLLLLEELSKTGKKTSELFEQYKKYSPSGEINFIVEDRDAALAGLKAAFADKADAVDDLDGYSFWFQDFWFNVRLSNTEPLLRLNVEGNTKEIMETHRDEIIAVIEQNGGKRKTSH